MDLGHDSGGASWHHPLRIDWRQPARTVESRVWAAPGKSYLEISGRRLYLLGADARTKSYPVNPGTLVRTDRFGLLVAAGIGSLRFSRVLIDGESIPVKELQLQQGTLAV